MPKAPIREALIDIQFAPVDSADIARIASEFAGGESSTTYDVWEGMFQLEVGSPGPARTNMLRNPIGKRIDFPGGQKVLQLRPGGFTFSRLQPYGGWEEMRDAALPLWRQYSDRIAPPLVTRVAVRYINALELPLPIKRFEDYLNCPPLLPGELKDRVIAGFLSRVVIPRDGATAAVTQSVEGEADLGERKFLKVTFDIDISWACKLPPEEFGAVEAKLEQLREFKNDVFFAFLTDKTLEMYE